MIEFNKNRPIYLQISEDIANKMLKGNLVPGDKLPSIRELASIYTVNPNTIQKVMHHLSSFNLVEVVRGIGTIVSKSIYIEMYKNKLIEKDVSEFIKKMKNQNYTYEDAITRIKEKWDK